MKVYLASQFMGLERKIQLEGGTIVKQSTDAELVLADPPVSGFDSTVLTGLGFHTYAGPKTTTHIFAKWFDGEEFSYQLFVGLPFLRLMNDDLGPPAEVGMAGRFVESVFGESLFNEELVEVLRDMKYKGFVTFDQFGRTTKKVWLGVPYLGLFNLIECMSGTVMEWFQKPKRLFECWTISSLFSRYPFPALGGEIEKSELTGLKPEVEKHFSLMNYEIIRRTVYTTMGVVGVATAWASEISGAAHRVLTTCRALDTKDKQFRTDLAWTAQERWERVLRENWI